VGNDGCSPQCAIENGYTCFGSPSKCSKQTTTTTAVAAVCGNGVVETGESCDDGNKNGGDGCSAGCLIEAGYSCTGTSSGVSSCSLLVAVCGDGFTTGTSETCDDKNTRSGDGCSASCTVESGWSCTRSATAVSVCTQTAATATTSTPGPTPGPTGSSTPLPRARLASLQTSTSTTSNTTALLHHSAVYLTGQGLIIFGGLVNGAASSDMYLIRTDVSGLSSGSTLAISKVSGLASTPPAVMGHRAVIYGNKMFVTGGWAANAAAAQAPLATHWAFDFTSFGWTEMAPMPAPRAFHAVHNLDKGSHIVIGGAATAALGSAGVSAVVKGGTFLSFGTAGYYRQAGNAWLAVAAEGDPVDGLPPPRVRFQSALSGGLLFVHGGFGEGGAVLGDVWMLAIALVNDARGLRLGTWSSLGSAGAPARADSLFAAAPAAGGAIILAGGVAAGEAPAGAAVSLYNVACPAGMYAEGLDSWACTPCPAGYESVAAGASACTKCAVGSYASTQGSASCTKCPALSSTYTTGSTNVTDCLCTEGDSYGPAGGPCKACPDGADCHGEAVHPLPGYARSTIDPYLMLPCNPSSSCLGGATSACATGYGGERCSKCATEPKRYYKLGFTCKECKEASLAPALVGIFFVGLLITALLYRISAGGASFGAVSISVHFFQVNNVIGSFTIPYPDRIRRFFASISAFSFNMDLVSPECKGTFSYFDKYGLTMLVPFIFIIFFAIIYALAALQSFTLRRVTHRTPVNQVYLESQKLRINQEDYKFGAAQAEEDTRRLEQRTLWEIATTEVREYFSQPIHMGQFRMQTCNAWIMLLTILYIPLVSACIGYFDCTYNVDGSFTLDADPAISCESHPTYRRLLPLASVCLIVYGFGLPALFAGILVHGHRSRALAEPLFRARFGVLYSKSEPMWFWFELLILIKKVVLVILSKLLSDHLLVQVTLSLAVLFSVLLFHTYAQPYRMARNNRLEFWLTVANTIVLFGGLLFYSNSISCSSKDECLALFGGDSTKTFIVLIVLITLSLAAAGIIYTVLREIIDHFRRKDRKDEYLDTKEWMLAEAVMNRSALGPLGNYFSGAGIRGRNAFRIMLRAVAPPNLVNRVNRMYEAEKRGIPYVEEEEVQHHLPAPSWARVGEETAGGVREAPSLPPSRQAPSQPQEHFVGRPASRPSSVNVAPSGALAFLQRGEDMSPSQRPNMVPRSGGGLGGGELPPINPAAKFE
jgi:cysteine-rich repeat protein